MLVCVLGNPSFLGKLIHYGTFLRLFGSEGSGQGQLKHPRSITVSGQEVYVTDENHRVHVFSKDGTFLRLFGSEST